MTHHTPLWSVVHAQHAVVIKEAQEKVQRELKIVQQGTHALALIGQDECIEAGDTVVEQSLQYLRRLADQYTALFILDDAAPLCRC